MPVVFVRKAQALPGKEAEAIKFGAEIAKMVADIVEVEVMVGQQVGGPIGQIGWRATYADMAAFEKAMGKIIANEPYRQHIAKHVPSISSGQWPRRTVAHALIFDRDALAPVVASAIWEDKQMRKLTTTIISTVCLVAGADDFAT